jgi:GAF domain-containing protein
MMTSTMVLSSLLRHVRATLSVDAASLSLTGTFLTASAGLPTPELADVLQKAGHGPAHETIASRRPVVIQDLAEPEALARFPRYASVALASCIRSVAVFPLIAGDVVIGTLHLYRYAPKALSAAELVEVRSIADVIAKRIALQPRPVTHDVTAG